MFETLYEIFKDYGWEGLMLGLFGIGIYLLMKYMMNKINKNANSNANKIAETLTSCIQNQNDLLVKNIGAQNEKLIDFFINNKSSEQLDHNHKLNERMQLAQIVNDKIKDIMYYMKSDRVMIIEFHNSNQNLSGIPFAKYSCTYEWFRRGIQPLASKCTNMSFSSLSSIVMDMQNEEVSQKIYEDIDIIAEANPSLYGLLDEINVSSIIYNGLYDTYNNLIGLLCVEYHKPISDNIDNELIALSNDANTISSILNLKTKVL